MTYLISWSYWVQDPSSFLYRLIKSKSYYLPTVESVPSDFSGISRIYSFWTAFSKDDSVNLRILTKWFPEHQWKIIEPKLQNERLGLHLLWMIQHQVWRHLAFLSLLLLSGIFTSSWPQEDSPLNQRVMIII